MESKVLAGGSLVKVITALSTLNVGDIGIVVRLFNYDDDVNYQLYYIAFGGEMKLVSPAFVEVIDA